MRSARNNRRGRWRACVALVVVSLGAAGGASFGQMVNTRPPETKKPATMEGVAVWYNVPPNSLAKRRAGKNELTAAHNRLPLGARVRVTHLANGKNVVARITDRGINKRGALIDLCKEAAQKLDMLREGSARVRVEVLPDDRLPTSKTTAPW